MIKHKWLTRLLLVGLGGVLGGGLTLWLFYEASVLQRWRHVQSQVARQLYGREAFRPHEILTAREFRGVRSPTSPAWMVRPGLDVVRVARGLSYPVSIAFVPRPADDPAAPSFYVTELHGTVKYVARDGSVHTYAQGLNNFDPLPDYESGQSGLTGIALVPDTEDLLITQAYADADSGLLSNRLVRLYSRSGGKALERAQVLLDLQEFTSSAHQIHHVAFGPDDKLYVSLGEGRNPPLSLDLERFGGKLLRLNLDGTPCDDNPFYQRSAATTPSQYVYAYGLRNVFGFDFHPRTGRLYALDNGRSIDRFLEIVPAGVYGWDGHDSSTRLNALYTWGPLHNTGPAGFAFLRRGTLGADSTGRGFGAMAGKTREDAAGPAKSIWEFVLDERTGLLAREPQVVLKYLGPDKSTVVGLAEGPDGLYFTDFFGPAQGAGNDAGRGNVWKLYASDATREIPLLDEQHLAGLSPAARGGALFARHCTSCHRLDGFGGQEGPDLTRAYEQLQQRLHSRGYEAALRKLAAATQRFLQQRPRYEELLSTRNTQRVRAWLRHHLDEPRFDNPAARMPGFSSALRPEERDAIVEYLISRGAP